MQFDVQWNITNAGTIGLATGYQVTTAFQTSTPYQLITKLDASYGFNSGSGLYAPGGTSTVPDIYTGWTLAVTGTDGTFYTVIGSSAVLYGSSTYAYSLTFLTPLPRAITTTDYISIIPPYFLQRGGAQNFIKRLRVLYGSLVLEDILEYKTLVRIFYEAGVDPGMAAGAQNILEGLYDAGHTSMAANGFNFEGNYLSTSYVIGNSATAATNAADTIALAIANSGSLPDKALSQLQCAPAISSTGTICALGTAAANTNTGRYTYTLNLLSGIFTQKKLIPLKWMASQLAIEITLSTEADCAITGTSMMSTEPNPKIKTATPTDSTLTYQWSNVNFIAEMLEFDSAYDDSFFQGLNAGGVPIKFDTFHYHSFSLSGAYNVLQIHERARSVKAAYGVVRDTSSNSTAFDSDKFFFNLAESWQSTQTTSSQLYYGQVSNPGQGQIQQFQWRVGGRYYPAQPVRTIYGAAEALIELQKALDTLGDYTRNSGLQMKKWSTNNGGLPTQFIMAAPFENADVYPNTISGINVRLFYILISNFFRLKSNRISPCF